MRSLARVSRHFHRAATDDSLWNPIAASWDIKIPIGKSPYLHMTEFHVRLLNQKSKVSFLEKELLWHNGTNLLIWSSDTDEWTCLDVYNYDLKIKHRYFLPPIKKIARHDNFVVTYLKDKPAVPDNLKKGIHVYEWLTGSLISSLAVDADTIQQLTVKEDRIMVIKNKSGETYAQLWTIEKNSHESPQFVSQFDSKIPINDTISSIKIDGNNSFVLTTDKKKEYRFCVEKKTQQLIPQKAVPTLELKPAQLFKSVSSEEDEFLAGMTLRLNQSLIVLRSKNKKKKDRVRVIVGTPSQPNMQEYSLEIPHFSKIFVRALGSLVLIGSDKGTVYRIDLLKNPDAKKAVKKLWKKTMFSLSLYYVRNFDFINNYLVLSGNMIKNLSPPLPNNEEKIKEHIRLGYSFDFITTIKIFD